MAGLSKISIVDILQLLQLNGEKFETVKIDQPLSADSERVLRAMPLLFPLPKLAELGRQNGKDVEKAEEWRAKGNLEFPKSKRSALEKYSKSIALSPVGSKQLALGYLNRSSALFQMQRYDASLRDLERAGSGGLPSESRYKLEELKARCLYALGRKEASQLAKKEALRLLQEAGDAVAETKATASRTRLLQMLHTKHKAPIKDTCKPLPTVVGGPHSNIPCLSRHIDVRFSSERGRHLVANQDIQPGEILIVEEPLAAMLLEPFYGSHCFHCMKRCLDMVPCKECSQAMFCSESCRDNAWASYHNIECIVLPVFPSRNDLGEPTTALSLTLRLMLKTFSAHGGLEAVHDKQKEFEAERRKGPEAKRIFDAIGRYDPNSLRAVYYLSRAYLGRPGCTTLEALAKQAAQILWTLKELSNLIPDDLQSDTSKFLAGLILRMNSIRLHTAFGIVESDGQLQNYFGGAMYAVLGLINHSCSPNAFQLFANGSIGILVATQPIEKGEEVTIAYTTNFDGQPRHMRRQRLASYQFVCHCRACLEDWPLLKEPTFTRNDYTLKCDGCGGRFQGPVNRSSVKCTHCSHRVVTDIVKNLERLKDKVNKTEGNWSVDVEPIRELHKVMAFPNDFLSIAQESVRLCFARSENSCKDSW